MLIFGVLGGRGRDAEPGAGARLAGARSTAPVAVAGTRGSAGLLSVQGRTARRWDISLFLPRGPPATSRRRAGATGSSTKTLDKINASRRANGLVGDGWLHGQTPPRARLPSMAACLPLLLACASFSLGKGVYSAQFSLWVDVFLARAGSSLNPRRFLAFEAADVAVFLGPWFSFFRDLHRDRWACHSGRARASETAAARPCGGAPVGCWVAWVRERGAAGSRRRGAVAPPRSLRLTRRRPRRDCAMGLRPCLIVFLLAAARIGRSPPARAGAESNLDRRTRSQSVYVPGRAGPRAPRRPGGTTRSIHDHRVRADRTSLQEQQQQTVRLCGGMRGWSGDPSSAWSSSSAPRSATSGRHGVWLINSRIDAPLLAALLFFSVPRMFAFLGAAPRFVRAHDHHTEAFSVYVARLLYLSRPRSSPLRYPP